MEKFADEGTMDDDLEGESRESEMRATGSTFRWRLKVLIDSMCMLYLDDTQPLWVLYRTLSTGTVVVGCWFGIKVAKRAV